MIVKKLVIFLSLVLLCAKPELASAKDIFDMRAIDACGAVFEIDQNWSDAAECLGNHISNADRLIGAMHTHFLSSVSEGGYRNAQQIATLQAAIKDAATHMFAYREAVEMMEFSKGGTMRRITVPFISNDITMSHIRKMQQAMCPVEKEYMKVKEFDINNPDSWCGEERPE